MKKVARTLRAHRGLLLNWFRSKGQLSRGVVEGFKAKATAFQKSLRFSYLSRPGSCLVSCTGLTRPGVYRQRSHVYCLRVIPIPAKMHKMGIYGMTKPTVSCGSSRDRYEIQHSP